MFERFTDRARAAVVQAAQEASELEHPRLGTAHLLLGIVHDNESVGGRVLLSLGVTPDEARRRVAAFGRGEAIPTSEPIAFTTNSKQLLEQSLRIAVQRAHAQIGTSDLTLALLGGRECTALRVLDDLGVDREAARALVLRTPAAASRPSRVPSASSVPVELSPEMQQLLRRAVRVGSSYVARRYASPRLVLGAVKTAGLIRTLNAESNRRPAELPAVSTTDPRAISAAAPLVAARCSVCERSSPECGTLYASAPGVLICESCASEGQNQFPTGG